ncbi:MAG TPA: hypothetical protein VGD58_32560 [Herpetosiphonaceae bacterium]
MNILVIGLAALVLLLLILNVRMIFAPRVNYYVIQEPQHQRSSGGCLLLAISLIIGVSLIALGGL